MRGLRPRGLCVLLVGIATTVGMSGCGNSAGVVVPAPGGAVQGGGAVARVGNVPIMKSAFLDRMAMEVRGEPAAVVKCVLALAKRGAEAAATDASGVSTNGCLVIYEQARANVLEELISGEWVLGAAAEEKISVSDRAVRAELAQNIAKHYPSKAAFNKELVKNGDNLPNLLFNLKVQMTSEKIRAVVGLRVGTVTPARVKAYYETHKAQFDQAEQRDFGIVRVRSAARAEQVKRELESGVSFAIIATRYGTEQPFYTTKGLLNELTHGTFKEKALDDALFSARPGVVSGPVRLYYTAASHFPRNSADIQNINGYYVFKVQHVKPRHQISLAEVEKSLTSSLGATLQQQGIAGYIAAWRARWRPRTNCMPGYVVEKCRQFTAASAGVVRPRPEDAYSLF